MKARVAKALEQQYVAQDSQGCLYSRSSASRAASSAAAHANHAVANFNTVRCQSRELLTRPITESSPARRERW
jgi:hypothetical protein